VFSVGGRGSRGDGLVGKEGGKGDENRNRKGKRMGERTIGSSRQLSASRKAIGHETLEEDRIEVGACEVDGSCVSGWARADDHLSTET
jgi:hypothetical protein